VKVASFIVNLNFDITEHLREKMMKTASQPLQRSNNRVR